MVTAIREWEMGFFKRILGICETPTPTDGQSWRYSGDSIEIELPRVPELSRRGGAIRLEGRGLPERLLVVHGNDGAYHAYGNRCTHMGRRVDPLAGSKNIRCCSVSKSTFDYGGRVTSGPAKGPLKTFEVASRGDRLIIALQKEEGSRSGA